VNIIPAIEVCCDIGEVLGYFIDVRNKKLIETLENESEKNQDKIKEWCAEIKKKGYNLSFSEIWKKYPKARGNINGFYPLYELYLKGYGTTRKIAEELEDKNISGKKIKKLSILRGICLVKNAGGVPVLAHPWLDDEVLKNKNFEKYV